MLQIICLYNMYCNHRQLDLQVFHALSYGSVSKAYMDSNMHTEVSFFIIWIVERFFLYGLSQM